MLLLHESRETLSEPSNVPISNSTTVNYSNYMASNNSGKGKTKNNKNKNNVCTAPNGEGTTNGSRGDFFIQDGDNNNNNNEMFKLNMHLHILVINNNMSNIILA